MSFEPRGRRLTFVSSISDATSDAPEMLSGGTPPIPEASEPLEDVHALEEENARTRGRRTRRTRRRNSLARAETRRYLARGVGTRIDGTRDVGTRNVGTRIDDTIDGTLSRVRV